MFNVNVFVRVRGVASIALGALGGTPIARSSFMFWLSAMIPSAKPSSAAVVLMMIWASTSTSRASEAPAAAGDGESCTIPIVRLGGSGMFSSVSASWSCDTDAPSISMSPSPVGSLSSSVSGRGASARRGVGLVPLPTRNNRTRSVPPQYDNGTCRGRPSPYRCCICGSISGHICLCV